MSPPKKSEPADSHGVLSNLPRTRPQRASPRRAAARKAAAAGAVDVARPSAPREPTAGAGARKPASSNGRPAQSTKDSRVRTARKPPTERVSAAPKRTRSAPKRTGTPTNEPAPRQGFECEGERVNGPVQPPGGAELVAGAAELIGELAKAGISTGERLFKDVLSRLPLS